MEGALGSEAYPLMTSITVRVLGLIPMAMGLGGEKTQAPTPL